MRPDVFPAIVVERDSEHRQAAARIGALEIDEPGDLNFATGAPGGVDTLNVEFRIAGAEVTV